jgi:hypothetical protein
LSSINRVSYQSHFFDPILETEKIGKILGKSTASYQNIIFFKIGEFEERTRYLWKKEKYSNVEKVINEILIFIDTVSHQGMELKLKIQKAKFYRMLGQTQK